MTSNVSHPSHYNLPGKKECIEQMREDYGDKNTAIFCLTNAYKYLYRAGHKGDAKEDIAKARWYFTYYHNMHVFIADKQLMNLRDYVKGELEKRD